MPLSIKEVKKIKTEKINLFRKLLNFFNEHLSEYFTAEEIAKEIEELDNLNKVNSELYLMVLSFDHGNIETLLVEGEIYFGKKG